MNPGQLTIELLQWVKDWRERITRVVSRVEKISGSGAAKVSNGSDGIIIHVDPQAAGAASVHEELHIRLSSASGSSAPFSYEGKLQKPDADAADGFSDANSTTFPVRNTWEREGTNAGYENTRVTGLKKLPTGFVYKCVGSRIISGTLTYLISERNEPDCTSA